MKKITQISVVNTLSLLGCPHTFVRLFVPLCLSVPQGVCLSIYICDLCLYVCISISIGVFASVILCVTVCLSVSLSVSVCISISACLCVCQSVFFLYPSISMVQWQCVVSFLQPFHFHQVHTRTTVNKTSQLVIYELSVAAFKDLKSVAWAYFGAKAVQLALSDMMPRELSDITSFFLGSTYKDTSRELFTLHPDQPTEHIG